MRRATLRITAESSTTRQCFIGKTPDRMMRHAAGLRHRGSQDRVDVEDDEQPVLEAVDAARERGPALVEIHRVRLVARRGELHHLADVVDEEAEGFAAVLEADRHLAPAALAASGSPSRRRRQMAVTTRPRRFRSPTISGGASGTGVSASGDEDVVHPVDRQAEQLVGDRHGDVFARLEVARRRRARRDSVAAIMRLLRRRSRLGERRDEAAAVELGHELGEGEPARPLDRLRRRRDASAITGR